jgi:hypothetical protein
MAFSRFPSRGELTLLGNWNDLVDEQGNGSIIAILKSFILPLPPGGDPVNAEIYDRDLRSRIGNFTDVIDIDNNGSFIAQLRAHIATLQSLLVEANIVLPFVKNLREDTDYIVVRGALMVRVDTTDEAKTVHFNRSTAALQRTGVYRYAGANEITVYDQDTVLAVINDTDVVFEFQDLLNETKLIRS